MAPSAGHAASGENGAYSRRPTNYNAVVNERRVILHVDMDAFFASIVQRDTPELRGKPVLVGHDGPRGVVAAASYEARAFGCRSSMPVSRARRLCPDAIIVGVPGQSIRDASGALFDLLGEFSPRVEPLSVDEAFVDLTGAERLLGPPDEVARRIKDRIRRRLDLTGSIGVAPNKFLAKLASDLDKPDGLTVVDFANPAAWLAGMPIGRMWGIGPRTEARLHERGIHRFADLQQLDPQWMLAFFGSDADRIRDLAHGLDDRPVVPDHQARSIGHEQTFGEDVANPDDVRRVLFDQAEQVGWRLRRRSLHAGRVTVKIRYGDFETITRSTTLQAHTDSTRTLWQTARGLFDTWAADAFRPVRLIGMSTSNLSRGEGQLGLFSGGESEGRDRRIDQTLDAITDRFGKRAVQHGAAMQPPKPIYDKP